MWGWCKKRVKRNQSSTGDPLRLAKGSLDRLRSPVLNLGAVYGVCLPWESHIQHSTVSVPPRLFQIARLHHTGVSQCSHKDRELILMTDMPPCCKSLETQNAGNGEDGNKRPNARTPPSCTLYREALLNSPDQPFPPHPDCLGCCIKLAVQSLDKLINLCGLQFLQSKWGYYYLHYSHCEDF